MTTHTVPATATRAAFERSSGPTMVHQLMSISTVSDDELYRSGADMHDFLEVLKAASTDPDNLARVRAQLEEEMVEKIANITLEEDDRKKVQEAKKRSTIKVIHNLLEGRIGT